VNPQRALRRNRLSTSFRDQDISSVSHTQAPLWRLFLSLLTTTLCRCFRALLSHTHTHTHRHTVSFTPLYAPAVGTEPRVGRQSEWSHYTAVTSHSFSLLSNQVSSKYKSNDITRVCHPAPSLESSHNVHTRNTTSSPILLGEEWRRRRRF